MLIRLADIHDIPAILDLHSRYHLSSIAPEDIAHGFVTTSFTQAQIKNLIEQEQGIVVAYERGQIAGYIMAASWEFWSQWPMFVYMIENLHKLTFDNQPLTTENSYQYGPVCIAREFRGQGLLERMFEYSRQHMVRRYPYLVTFINKRNPRSFIAHTQKIGLQVIAEFHYNQNDFYELAYSTATPLSPNENKKDF